MSFFSGTDRCRRGVLRLQFFEPSLGDVFVCGFRHPFPGDADHQRPSVLSHDLLMCQELRRRRLDGQGALHHRRVRPVHKVMARISVRIKVLLSVF